MADSDGNEDVDLVAASPLEAPVVSCPAPVGGLYRVGRAVDPMRASFVTPDIEAHARQGNRFDTSTFGIVYMGTELECCFGETLARYRPKPDLAALVEDDWRGFMGPGQVAAEWREKRAIAHATVDPEERFLDIEALETREYLRIALALGLSSLGYNDLDVPLVRGPDRRVTRLVAQWAFNQANAEGGTVFAGIRYLSRIDSDWECWALFEDVFLESTRVESIPEDHPALLSVSKAFNLRVH